MLTIDAAGVLGLHHRVGGLGARSSGPSRLRPTILSWNRGEASAASAYGAPPALLTSTSSRPCSATTRVDQRLHGLGVAHVAARGWCPATGVDARSGSR